jgi:prepilin-type N-terminal cleavage/methylation domain-containing protein
MDNNAEMRKSLDVSGFSLIELLVVITIIGLLAAIAIPSYVGIKNKARASSMVRAAQTSLAEIQFWLQCSLSSNDRQVDSNFDGKVDGSDKTNSQLKSDGVAVTYAAGRNDRLKEMSPFFPEVPLWNADGTVPPGRITLSQISQTSIREIVKDKEGYVIFEKTVSAD